MKKFIPLSAVLMLAISSCSWLGGEDGLLPDRRDSYRDADVLPPMAIPETLDSYTIDELFVIPSPVNTVAEVFEAVPMPKPIDRRGREGVIIQTLGDQSWIVLDAPQDQVWARIKDYWDEQQVALDYENPNAGLMETGWVEVDGDIRTRNKYRTTIESGLIPGYSEIFIRHISLPRSEPTPILTNWPDVSEVPERERQILESLSQYLADRNDIYQARSTSFVAGARSAESKANLIRDAKGEPILELNLNYNRAWVLVRQALERAEVNILSSNRDQAVYSVNFAGSDADESSGFFGGLFGGGDDDAVDLNFSIRLLETGSVINVVAEPLGEESELLSDSNSSGAGNVSNTAASELTAAEDLLVLKNQLLRLINDNLT